LSNVLDLLKHRLTDNYKKNPESNVTKLLSLIAEEIQKNEDAIEKIAEWRDIDIAEGKTLDKIGADFKQYRGLLDDEPYRVLIKSRIKRNLSDGSINTLIEFFSVILQVPYEEVEIIELWEQGQHAALKMEFPLESIVATGLSLNQFSTFINMVTAVGVRAEVLFEGTFAFASGTSEELDAEAGFSDIEGSTGGYFGAILDNNNPLPV
jgi:hypothetical protein